MHEALCRIIDFARMSLANVVWAAPANVLADRDGYIRPKPLRMDPLFGEKKGQEQHGTLEPETPGSQFVRVKGGEFRWQASEPEGKP